MEAATPAARAPVPPAAAALAAGPRLARTTLAWGLMFAAGPGIVWGDGSALLEGVGLAIWAAAVRRPAAGRRRWALGAEIIAGGLGWTGIMGWVAYVFGPALGWVALGMGIYAAIAGVLLRWLSRGLPLAPALALAFCGMEALRGVIPLPFGLAWLQLGHHLHHHLFLSGSARFIGLEGLGLLLALMAGAALQVVLQRRVTWSALVFGLGAPLLAALLAMIGVPRTEPGPRVLLVQPGFEQARKQRDDPRQNLLAQTRLSAAGVRAMEQRGELPDLVCWGETLLYTTLLADGVIEKLEAGVELSPSLFGLDAAIARRIAAEERDVLARLFGGAPESSNGAGGGILPPGTSFLAGAELLDVFDGVLSRFNSVAMYDALGRRTGVAHKCHLVPGAETMAGLERLASVRDAILEIAGYVPDLAPGSETGVLELTTRAGDVYSVGVSVCFDNAFLDPYLEPLLRGPLDFHVVASNEAWYEDSWEMDQMIAFSRIAALASGRSVVRATNSGVSLGIDPLGRELARVRVDGRDRAVSGTVSFVVPVPPRTEAEPGPTLYAHLRNPLRGALLVAALGFAIHFRWRRGNQVQLGG